ncbi:hypothetical protein PUN28_007428 [Cardiocondyla obscurior]|uniref:Uncharacterized protein n=1 Tax=Cardiocondyla obscurior TaxID=286306 RepID=A0AAW2G694_9HYME
MNLRCISIATDVDTDDNPEEDFRGTSRKTRAVAKGEEGGRGGGEGGEGSRGSRAGGGAGALSCPSGGGMRVLPRSSIMFGFCGGTNYIGPK